MRCVSGGGGTVDASPPLDLGVSEILTNQEKGFDVFV